MPTIPQWVIGANVTTFTLAPCSVDTAGAITVNAAGALQGRWQRFSITPAYELKEIAASDQFVKSQVPTGFGMTAEIEEIEQLAGVDPNTLQSVFNGCRLALLTVARNIQSGLTTWQAYLVINDFKMEGQREEFIDTITMKLTSVRDDSNAEISLTVS